MGSIARDVLKKQIIGVYLSKEFLFQLAQVVNESMITRSSFTSCYIGTGNGSEAADANHGIKTVPLSLSASFQRYSSLP
jgi:hypothetical protein